MDVSEILFENTDEKYAEFQRKLIPNIDPKSIIGVRTPMLRRLAKEIGKTDSCKDFLNALPHKYFDENQLHSFIISQEKDFEECIKLVEEFLPFINNWATCDQLSPKVFAKHLPEIREKIFQWVESERTYTVRFGVEIAMTYFLGENFDEEIMEKISKIRSEEYYVRMMVAWYFATALSKQWDDVIKIIESKKLDDWTHNKTIQKACESYRITAEQKEYLKNLKV